MAHLRRPERVIIVRVSQTHKYNDLPLSKLPAPGEIKGVPPELAMVWGGGWWEVLHWAVLSGTVTQTRICPRPALTLFSPPAELAREPGPGRRWWERLRLFIYLGRRPGHNIFPRNTGVFKGQVDADLTE